jgi:protein TonB
MVTRLPLPFDPVGVPLRVFDPARRVETSRSLLGATIVVSLAFAAIGTAWRFAPEAARPMREPIPVGRIFDLLPPPALEREAAAPSRPTPAAPAHAGVPHPVTTDPPQVTRPTTGGGTGVLIGGDAVDDAAGARNPGPVLLAEPQAARPGIFDVHDVEPEPRVAPAPEYPDLARQAQVEGVVVLRVLVERDGSVGEIVVERSVPLMDEAAITAVRRWVFSPARTGDHPVKAWVLVPFRFRLREGR